MYFYGLKYELTVKSDMAEWKGLLFVRYCDIIEAAPHKDCTVLPKHILTGYPNFSYRRIYL
jgi:hypothetical protein